MPVVDVSPSKIDAHGAKLPVAGILGYSATARDDDNRMKPRRSYLTLEDGTRLRIRRARPDDKQRILDGFQRLSPQSRYNRFFTAKSELTTAELKAFTEFDGVNHLAVGAVRVNADGNEGEGLGIARFVRDEVDPTVADVAVAVVDDRQGQGIGHALVKRLARAAADLGVERFRARVLADNDRALDALSSAAPGVQMVRDGDLVRVEIPLPPAARGLSRLIRRALKLGASRHIGVNISRWLDDTEPPGRVLGKSE